MQRVLHVLSQRPLMTGSGITLDALVRHAGAEGQPQAVLVGLPADAPSAEVGGPKGVAAESVVFGEPPLDFPLPGMSDVMPYPSARFSELSAAQLRRYRAAWRDRLAAVIESFQPDLIHSHHLWIVSALLKDVAPAIPVVNHCHGTGLRQMRLCPHLADEVRQGCRRNDRFLALHHEQAKAIADALTVPRERVDVIGAGYRQDVFFPDLSQGASSPTIGYAGKYSHAKGLPFLLDAVERLRRRFPDVRLHVAGSGSGPEADALRARMECLAPMVVLHGQLGQAQLADLLRRCSVFALPSFYEGLPLVLVEAFACGCRLVATALPGIETEIARHLGPALATVPLPRLIGPDQPEVEDRPKLVDDLEAALAEALRSGPLPAVSDDTVRPFTWSAVFERIHAIWGSLA